MKSATLLLALATPLLAANGTANVVTGRQATSDTDTPQTESGRVIDATTGEPVASATIEIWTEETDKTTGGFHQVDATTSAADGRFTLITRKDGILGDKILVRAPGYLTFPGTIPDAELVRLLPKPRWDVVVRITDLLDHPIEGAHVTSTYSCAHDVPAVDVLTDADGIATLTEWGWQDHVGELRVRAPGYMARKYVSWHEVAPDGSGAPATIRLARQRTLQARILKSDGTALAGTSLHIYDGEGHHVPRTDATGRFAVDSTYEGRAPTLYVLGDGREEHVYSGGLPTDRLVSIRVGGEDWPDYLPCGMVLIAVDSTVPYSLFHESGWVDTRDGEFPAGRFVARFGGAFTGWEEHLLELELGEGEQLPVTPDLRRQPRLTLLTSGSNANRIVIQVGDQSIERSRTHQVTVPVPAGREIVVYEEDLTETRRRVLSGIRANTTIDLRDNALLVPPTRGQRLNTADRARQRVTIEGDAKGKLSARGPGRPTVEELGPGQYEVDAIAGFPLLLTFTVSGRYPSTVSVLAGDGPVVMRAAAAKDPHDD